MNLIETLNVIDRRRARILGAIIGAGGLIALEGLALLDVVPPTTGVNFLVIFLATIVGGLRVGLASLIVINTIAQYRFPIAWPRFAFLIVTMTTIVLVTGYGKRALLAAWEKNRYIDSINGNIKLLDRVHKNLGDLYRGWEVLKPAARRDNVGRIWNDVTNLRTLVEGWHELAGERERAKQEMHKKKATP